MRQQLYVHEVRSLLRPVEIVARNSAAWARRRLKTTGQLDAEMWKTTRPVNLARRPLREYGEIVSERFVGSYFAPLAFAGTVEPILWTAESKDV